MILREWRDLPPSAIVPLRDRDLARWSASLAWDARSAWREIESARASGLLPGLVAEEDGRAVGWTFYLPHGSSLQIGAFTADDDVVTHALVDELLISPEADAATEVMIFALDAAPGLASTLGRRGFATDVYRYLQRPLTRGPQDPACTCQTWGGSSDAPIDGPTGRSWHAGDADGLQQLLARAYATADPARPFARTGSDAEWREYVRQLIATGGCGEFLPGLSRVVASASTDRLDAAFVVTRVAETTAHLAQCLVDPAAGGRGLATTAMHALAGRLGAAGFERLTLLVGNKNVRAARLYERLGFAETAQFVSAVRDQPRRSSSAAFETGGVRTLR
jgi:ribosomal protein S18 acetylase RimI-like enzyme